MGLLLAATGLMGGLYAQSGTTAISITNANPAAGGRLATITEVASSASLVAKGNSQRIQGVALYDITNIAPGFENSLTLRFYILNPQDIGLAFGSDNTFIELKVTDFSNPNIIYASGRAFKDMGSIILLPRGVPQGTTKLKLRGAVTIPGGRSGGAQQPGQTSLATQLELSLEATQG